MTTTVLLLAMITVAPGNWNKTYELVPKDMVKLTKLTLTPTVSTSFLENYREIKVAE